MNAIELSSPAFDDQDVLPEKYSRQGGNVSPPLVWTGVPPDAAELLLLCEDPDAGGFVHWLVTDIPATMSHVTEGEMPPGGRARRNSFGEMGWAGPQPPVGDAPHHYVFQLYALTGPPQLPDGANGADIRRAIEDQQLAADTLTGLFARG
jgi:Raf kinase inhibitor-like YbhB/YbcL family protein